MKRVENHSGRDFLSIDGNSSATAPRSADLYLARHTDNQCKQSECPVELMKDEANLTLAANCSYNYGTQGDCHADC